VWGFYFKLIEKFQKITDMNKKNSSEKSNLVYVKKKCQERDKKNEKKKKLWLELKRKMKKLYIE